MRQIITVRAIIKRDDKVLLLRRSMAATPFGGLYELPGGKVDFGEDPKATLGREVQEEIGCEIETMQLSNVYSNVDTDHPEKQYVSLVFWVSIKGNAHVQLSSEHDKYAWKKVSEIQLH